jgi:Type I phosphodiesterase / nucleotide pyrophosphatase
VVLLCIDGADFDDMVLPMVAAGELPNFARLLAEGTSGELATIEPTLSAVVWTTLATSKPPAVHGIHHFVNFRLPGLGPSIEQFPLHTGLNFHLFPLLERLPGMPPLQAPYTSNMRRAEALWGIVGRVYPVGAFQWLITWPAEPVPGFMVSGGLGWVQFAGAGHGAAWAKLRRLATWPPELDREVAAARRSLRRRITPALFRPYLGRSISTAELAAATGRGGDPRLRTIAASLGDPTATLLPRLIRRFDARFTASSFYPVDPYDHLFAADRAEGGPAAGAIAAAYRFTGARLGRLLAVLGAGGKDADGEPFELIVVSDHGFDYVHRHHAWAPSGIFIARGPAFTPDRRVATYEGGTEAAHAPVSNPLDDELRDELRALGYIR